LLDDKNCTDIIESNSSLIQRLLAFTCFIIYPLALTCSYLWHLSPAHLFIKALKMTYAGMYCHTMWHRQISSCYFLLHNTKLVLEKFSIWEMVFIFIQCQLRCV